MDPGSISNKFINLINQQITNYVKPITNNQTTQNQTQKEKTSPLDELFSNLAKTIQNNSAQNLLAQALTQVNSLGLTSTELNMFKELLNKLFYHDDDRLFYQPNNFDNYINAINKVKVIGGDVLPFLRSLSKIVAGGHDAMKFIATVLNVIDKGDYDDLRRFFSVLDTVMARRASLDKFYEFGNKILDKRHYDYESNIFALQTALSYGCSMDDFLAITDNLQTTGLEGRNNLVDFHRIIIDVRKRGGYLPVLFKSMADEARKPDGDVRGYMNDYMKMYGLKYSGPDFTKFNRIERIDGEDMVIKKGESAALFAQAISNVDGLLPESVLYWSSLEEGALSHGSSYLDLSKLDVGVHHIVVKIGGYWRGGTDTAIKTVIVLPPDEEEEHHDNGHGNDADGVDESNPGNSTGITPKNDNTNRFIEPEIIAPPPPPVTPPPPPPVTPPPPPVTPPPLPPVTPPPPVVDNKIVLPEDGKLKITVEKGSAGLSSDVYLKLNGEDTLITKNAQTNYGVTLEKDYKKGDALDFFIRTHGESWGLGTYDHGTNTEPYKDGRYYVKIDKLSDTSWRLSFEDLPGNKADWDYNDVVIKVELVPNKQESTTPPPVPPVKIHKDNGHGNDVDRVDESNPGNSKGVSTPSLEPFRTFEKLGIERNSNNIKSIDNLISKTSDILHSGKTISNKELDDYFLYIQKILQQNDDYVRELKNFLKKVRETEEFNKFLENMLVNLKILSSS